ncbi:MAG TPA: DMT family transporter [Chryseosolibacter sp.]|nr:DMT family transporter [Chryseosolibacter sp.]
MTANRYFVSGVVISLVGAICFSTKAVLVKMAYHSTAVDAVTLLALRMLFSLPFFVISAAIASSKSDNIRFTGKQWFQIAILGALGYYLSSLLDFLGLQYVSAGIERLILFIYPTLVLLLSSFFFKKKVTQIQWIAVAITYAGLLWALLGEASIYQETNPDFYKGAFLIFACAITFALYIVGSGAMIPVVGAAKFNSYAMTFACIGVLFHFYFTADTSLFNLDWAVYGYSLLMAILSTVIPSYLVTEGIKRIGSGNAAIVGSIGPVSTIVQAYFLLAEPIFAAQIFGTILVLMGVVLIGKK